MLIIYHNWDCTNWHDYNPIISLWCANPTRASNNMQPSSIILFSNWSRSRHVPYSNPAVTHCGECGQTWASVAHDTHALILMSVSLQGIELPRSQISRSIILSTRTGQVTLTLARLVRLLWDQSRDVYIWCDGWQLAPTFGHATQFNTTCSF
jgi:hypothetical protein